MYRNRTVTIRASAEGAPVLTPSPPGPLRVRCFIVESWVPFWVFPLERPPEVMVWNVLVGRMDSLDLASEFGIRQFVIGRVSIALLSI